MNMDDELMGFNVFNVFNSVYQLKEANVAYSNFLEFHVEQQQILKGYASAYTTE